MHQHIMCIHMRLSGGSMPSFRFCPSSSRPGISQAIYQIWFTIQMCTAYESQIVSASLHGYVIKPLRCLMVKAWIYSTRKVVDPCSKGRPQSFTLWKTVNGALLCLNLHFSILVTVRGKVPACSLSIFLVPHPDICLTCFFFF